MQPAVFSLPCPPHVLVQGLRITRIHFSPRGELASVYYVYLSYVSTYCGVCGRYVGKVQWLKQASREARSIARFMEWSGMGVPVTYVRVALS